MKIYLNFFHSKPSINKKTRFQNKSVGQLGYTTLFYVFSFVKIHWGSNSTLGFGKILKYVIKLYVYSNMVAIIRQFWYENMDKTYPHHCWQLKRL